MELILKVSGMTCGHCKASVEGTVKGIQGVETAVVDLDNKEVKISGNDLNEVEIKEAIEGIGFDVE